MAQAPPPMEIQGDQTQPGRLAKSCIHSHPRPHRPLSPVKNTEAQRLTATRPESRIQTLRSHNQTPGHPSQVARWQNGVVVAWRLEEQATLVLGASAASGTGWGLSSAGIRAERSVGFPGRRRCSLTPLVMMTGMGHHLFSEGRRRWNASSLPDLYCPCLFPNSLLNLLELTLA